MRSLTSRLGLLSTLCSSEFCARQAAVLEVMSGVLEGGFEDGGLVVALLSM